MRKYFVLIVSVLFVLSFCVSSFATYSYQSFSVSEVLTAAKMNQISDNVRDHVHGADSVAELSAYARLADAETVTGVWTFQGTVPQFRFEETGVAAENGRWQFSADGEALRFYTLNDADTLSTLWLEVNRTGIVVDNIYLNAKVGIGGSPTTKLHVYDDTVNFGTTLEQANGTGKILQLKATASDNLNTTSAVDVEIDTVSVLKVTNAGNIAIGNVTPDTTLHVYRGDSGGSSSTYSGLTVEDDADVFLQILTPNVNVGGILFGDPQGSSVGQIRYDHASNNLSFYTNGGQQISINSSGQLVSSLATGTAPLTVASTTGITNLNADMVDGLHAGNTSGYIPVSNGTVNTNLNADMVDGIDLSINSSSYVWDDFIGGDTASGMIGEMGWKTDSVVSYISSTSRPGLIRIDGTSNGEIYLERSINPSLYFDMTFIVYPFAFTDGSGLLGLGGANIYVSSITDGIYFSHTSGGNWIGTCRSSSSSSTVDTGAVASNSTWYRLRVRRIDGSTIGFTVDGGTEYTVTTNIPTIDLRPFVSVNSTAGEDYLDLFTMKVTGLNR